MRSAFDYMCLHCGEGTFDSGVSLPGDDSGTRTLCHTCADLLRWICPDCSCRNYEAFCPFCGKTAPDLMLGAAEINGFLIEELYTAAETHSEDDSTVQISLGDTVTVQAVPHKSTGKIRYLVVGDSETGNSLKITPGRPVK